MSHIPKLIVSCISGFTQSADRMNGTMQAVLTTIEDNHGECVRVNYHTWDDDIDGAAEFHHRAFPDVPHIIWGYSLGGEAAANLANKLCTLGESVDGLVIVDGVVSGWLRPWRWLVGKIQVDAAVKQVHSYIQRTDKPDGDQVLHGGEPVEQVEVTHVTHNSIDEHYLPQERLRAMIEHKVRNQEKQDD
jgi:pimeloyl-ACP methyl ester carboxylesterase